MRGLCHCRWPRPVLMPPPDSPSTLRFGEFALDVAAYQLRRDGRPVKLGRQPMDLLILLVERHGQLVTRADIVARLWGPDVFVDVEMGVNTAISKVRQALRDAPDAPRFLETVSGKGYRFIAPVDGAPPCRRAGHAACRAAADRPGPRHDRGPPHPARRRPPAIAVAAIVVLLAVIAVGVLAVWRARTTERADRRGPRRAALRQSRQRRRSRLPRRRAHRRNQRLAGTHRSRASHGEGTHRSHTAAPPRRRRRSARSCRSTTSSRARSAPKAHASG